MTNFASVGRRTALAAAAGLAVTTVIATSASAAAAPWTVVPSANAGAGVSDQFRAVSMLDDSHGFAVGVQQGHSIIESWNGTGWSYPARAPGSATS